MRHAFLTIGGAMLAACASVGSGAGAPTSWGKAGVTLVQYWTDSSECALVGSTATPDANGSTVDLSGSGSDRTNPGGAANASARPTHQPSGIEATTDLNNTLMAAHYNEMQRDRSATRARQQAVETCLRERGYRPFRLTSEQGARLAELPEGSNERRAYLYQLGSDPAVLSAQGL